MASSSPSLELLDLRGVERVSDGANGIFVHFVGNNSFSGRNLALESVWRRKNSEVVALARPLRS
jgi:hypothetical protein